MVTLLVDTHAHTTICTAVVLGTPTQHSLRVSLSLEARARAWVTVPRGPGKPTTDNASMTNRELLQVTHHCTPWHLEQTQSRRVHLRDASVLKHKLRLDAACRRLSYQAGFRSGTLHRHASGQLSQHSSLPSSHWHSDSAVAVAVVQKDREARSATHEGCANCLASPVRPGASRGVPSWWCGGSHWVQGKEVREV